jgi:hypothetical protein
LEQPEIRRPGEFLKRAALGQELRQSVTIRPKSQAALMASLPRFVAARATGLSSAAASPVASRGIQVSELELPRNAADAAQFLFLIMMPTEVVTNLPSASFRCGLWP